MVYPVLMGDSETGVAIMVMDSGMDTGPVLIQKRIPLLPRTSVATLTTDLAHLGAEALCQALPLYLSGTLKPIPQAQEGVTLAPKIKKEMGQLDWLDSAWYLLRKIDALQPWPGTWGGIGGQNIGILAADAKTIENSMVGIPTGPSSIGTIAPWEKSWAIVCGQNTLLIPKKVRSIHGKIMDGPAFLQGYRSLLWSNPSGHAE